MQRVYFQNKGKSILTNIGFRYILISTFDILEVMLLKDKTLTYGNVDMLVLKLLENHDMYGYEIIEQLDKQSNNIFKLSAGSLYPLLHNLESKRLLESYEAETDNKTPGKTRKYYRITAKGKNYLEEKSKEWERYSLAINNILFKERRTPT